MRAARRGKPQRGFGGRAPPWDTVGSRRFNPEGVYAVVEPLQGSLDYANRPRGSRVRGNPGLCYRHRVAVSFWQDNAARMRGAQR